MKDCKIFRQGLCNGCPGLAEYDWIGPEACRYYKKMTQKVEFKEIEGEQIWIKK